MTAASKAHLGLLLAAFSLLGGCAGSLPHHAQTFAAAGAPAIADTQSAFDLAQAGHAAAVLAANVHKFETTPLSKLTAQPSFGSSEDADVRAHIFALLGAYVEGLRAVSGGKAASPAGAAAGAAAAASLAGDSAAIPDIQKPALSNTTVADAAAAIERIEVLLANRARRRALPRILAQADPAIAAVCATLRRDIGSDAGPGLRNQVHLDYEQRIQLASSAIRDHAAGYSYPEREQAIRKVFALVAQQRQADAVLAQADALLASFAAAHHALTLQAAHDAAATSVVFTRQVGQLALNASQLGAAEQELTATGKDLP